MLYYKIVRDNIILNLFYDHKEKQSFGYHAIKKYINLEFIIREIKCKSSQSHIF